LGGWWSQTLASRFFATRLDSSGVAEGDCKGGLSCLTNEPGPRGESREQFFRWGLLGEFARNKKTAGKTSEF